MDFLYKDDIQLVFLQMLRYENNNIWISSNLLHKLCTFFNESWLGFLHEVEFKILDVTVKSSSCILVLNLRYWTEFLIVKWHRYSPLTAFQKYLSFFIRFLKNYFNILSSLSFDFSTFKTIQNNYFCICSTICHINSLVIYNLLYMTTFQGYMLTHFWNFRIKAFKLFFILENIVL